MLIDKENGILLQSVDSTNTYCKKNEIQTGYWVLANEQTEGRGRKGRTWISLGDERIIFSCKFALPEIKNSISLLSLFIGSVVLKTLQEHFSNLKTILTIKWPNDIYLDGKKVSGILIESEYMDGKSIFIAGIGINIFGIENLLSSGYLSETPMGKAFRTNMVYALIKYINEMEFILQNPESIQKELDWIYSHSLLRNKKIETSQNGENISGYVTGYDRNGFLIVKKENGIFVSVIDTGPDFKVI